MALVNVNRNVREDGTPLRLNQSNWILQIPHSNRKPRGNLLARNDGLYNEQRSVYSNMTVYSESTMDPGFRMKAE